jgi:hypothetical protein
MNLALVLKHPVTVGANLTLTHSHPIVIFHVPVSKLGFLFFGGGLFFSGFFFVFQPGFVAFVNSVASVAFVGVWLLWLLLALPIYLSIYLSNLT